MYRRTGIIVLLLTLLLTAWLLWLPVRYFTGYSISTENVQEIYLPCGSAIGILADRFDPAIGTPGARLECTKRARGRIFLIVALDIPLLLIGGYAFARGPFPNRSLHG